MQRLIYTEVDDIVEIGLNKSIKEVDDKSGYSGLMTYGNDNLYPQTIEKIIQNSTTGKSVVGIVTKFLMGEGFENEAINDIIIGKDSRGKEIKVKSLLRKIVYDIVLFNGFYVHTKWNIEQKVGEYTHTPFKDCRFSKVDEVGFSPKVLFCPDWRNSKSKGKNKNIIDYSIYTANKESFVSQVNKQADGEIEKYNGQMYFNFFDQNFFYPVSQFDACYLDLDTEFQLEVHKNRTVRNGFLPKTLMRVSPPESEQEQEKLEKKLKSFIGVDGDNFMAIYDNALNSEGEIQESSAAMFDKVESSIAPDLFNSWVADLQASIRSSWNVPKIFTDYDASKLGTTSGETIIQATRIYNALTRDVRSFISESFKELFALSANEILEKNKNWKIKELSLFENENLTTE